MNIISQKKYNDQYDIEIINDKNEIINIGYVGSDFYWTCYNYTDDNEFIITAEDGRFYYDLAILLDKIKKYCRPYDKIISDNKFEWISEAYGEEEFAHKLIIEKQKENFKIKFFQNPLNFFRVKGTCPVCFCLSGSRNQKIACEFSMMFLKYKNMQEESRLSRKIN